MTAVLTHSGSKSSKCWRELHEAVLFENDVQRLRLGIDEAESALMERASELFAVWRYNSKEVQAIDNALTHSGHSATAWN